MGFGAGRTALHVEAGVLESLIWKGDKQPPCYQHGGNSIVDVDNRKVAHTHGVVFAFSNKSRDIGSTKPVHFNKLNELPKAIIETIERSNVTLVEKNKSGIYEQIELNETLICGDKNEI